MLVRPLYLKISLPFESPYDSDIKLCLICTCFFFFFFCSQNTRVRENERMLTEQQQPYSKMGVVVVFVFFNMKGGQLWLDQCRT